jgi:hypothetical protein
MLRMMLAVGAALILLGSIAAAQTRAAVKVCAADIESQCGKFQPGSSPLRECMQAHFQRLLPNVPSGDSASQGSCKGMFCRH